MSAPTSLYVTNPVVTWAQAQTPLVINGTPATIGPIDVLAAFGGKVVYQTTADGFQVPAVCLVELGIALKYAIAPAAWPDEQASYDLSVLDDPATISAVTPANMTLAEIFQNTPAFVATYATPAAMLAAMNAAVAARPAAPVVPDTGQVVSIGEGYSACEGMMGLSIFPTPAS